MPSDINIAVNSLSRHFATLCAVDQLSFSVKRGEILGFLGPNGAGKSTTLQMLTGTLAPSSGKISICGVDLLTQPRLAKQHLGFLPEIPPLYPDFSVDEYLRFCARIRHIIKSQVATAVAEAKEKCGLSEVGRRLIGNLSKGYQQRVGIAQAIIHNPDVVILDEPTVGLDPIQIREIRQLIRDIGKEHSVILSSHILPEIQSTCDRVQIIHHGRIVFSDTVDNLSQHMATTSLIVGLRNPPNIERLEQINSVNKVELLTDKKYRLQYDDTRDAAEIFVSTSVTNDWGLYHISAEQRSLEQIFVDITTTEVTTDKEEAEAENHPTIETNLESASKPEQPL